MKHKRKCDNCRYLCSEGYEYPEYYCGAGVAEDDKHCDGEGCSYTIKTLEKLKHKYDAAYDAQFDISDEEIQAIFIRDKCFYCKYYYHADPDDDKCSLFDKIVYYDSKKCDYFCED